MNTWSKFIFLGFLMIVLFFLLTEHRAHLFGFLPYLLVLACPLMHLLHGRHGGHPRHDHEIHPKEPNPERGS